MSLKNDLMGGSALHRPPQLLLTPTGHGALDQAKPKIATKESITDALNSLEARPLIRQCESLTDLDLRRVAEKVWGKDVEFDAEIRRRAKKLVYCWAFNASEDFAARVARGEPDARLSDLHPALKEVEREQP